jgi:Transcriptional regulator/sugar kinase
MTGSFFDLSDIREALDKALAEVPDHPLKKKNRYTTSDVVALFEAGDPLVTSILDRSARYNAIELLAVANFLDVDYLVLQGRILTFGERYHALLNHYFALYDLNHNQAKIVFSTLGSRANLLGAVYQGGNIYWLKRFGEMTAKRTTSGDYDVTVYFGDNI